MAEDTGPEGPALIIREIEAKSILTASKIYPYVINPYVGCQHACSYCYARYMKKFTGHREPWGSFVDVKVNADALLGKEITRKKKATVWVSGVCDPYQPLEEKYQLTRRCLQILIDNDWPVVVQTRSPLVLRDIDILRGGKSIEVGFSVTTADDDIRKVFEPHAPPIADRVEALGELKRSGIRTYAMIAPILPGAENLMEMLAGKVDYILVDRMNYHYADALYRKLHLEEKLTEGYATWVAQQIAADCKHAGISCTIVF
ncbi:radical SAM protein [Geomonas sp. Red32]|uniref:SPL family radical SAM protein n=1 Tax=Geomonas sp. Red32 TaxID=2912856 RepID=UPI00202CAB52|nr:radical SAM protein [Geomonas sp. Red32]MCM0081961.1 radical SAM protein [Geomonas sp. Red32]